MLWGKFMLKFFKKENKENINNTEIANNEEENKEQKEENKKGKKEKKLSKLTEILNTKLNAKSVEELKETYTLKGVIIAEGILLIIMFIWNAILMFRPKQQIGYVVEVNALTGEQRKISSAVKEMKDYTASEYLLSNTVQTYIKRLRTVSNDIGVNQDNIKWVYSYTTEKAKGYIEEFYTENNPIERNKDKNERVEVFIYNIQPLNQASGIKFLVDWNEQTRDSSGKLLRENNYRADIDVKQFKATKQTAENNPTGMYITSINITDIKNLSYK